MSLANHDSLELVIVEAIELVGKQSRQLGGGFLLRGHIGVQTNFDDILRLVAYLNQRRPGVVLAVHLTAPVDAWLAKTLQHVAASSRHSSSSVVVHLVLVVPHLNQVGVLTHVLFQSVDVSSRRVASQHVLATIAQSVAAMNGCISQNRSLLDLITWVRVLGQGAAIATTTWLRQTVNLFA